MNRQDIVRMLDSLSDESLMRLISELTWLSVCRRAYHSPSVPEATQIKAIMLESAKDYVIARMMGEAEDTEPGVRT